MQEDHFWNVIGEQARDEVESILAEAGREAARVRERAGAEAGEVRDAILGRARRKCDDLRSRILNEAHLEVARIRLDSRYRAVEDILAALRQKIAGPVEGARKELLARLLDECVVPGGAILSGKKEDRAVLEEIGRERGITRIEVDDDNDSGGITVLAEDGRFIERNTFSDRLQKSRSRLLQAITRNLFHQGGQERTKRSGR